MISSENLADVGRSIQLCYSQFGEPADPPIVLIAGLGQQLHAWPMEFVLTLAERGFCVTRFDNRDAGRSTHLDPATSSLFSMFCGDRRASYDLADMASDTVGLLDALGYADAHIVGMSMGGVIGQTLAVQYPHRVRTLTLIMSSTGTRRLGRLAWSVWWRILTSHAPQSGVHAMDQAAKMLYRNDSHGFPFDEAARRRYAALAWERQSSYSGAMRQLAAVSASLVRVDQLREIDVPTLVIHGDRDRKVHRSGGAAAVRAIPRARLEAVVGLGHDMPSGVWGRLADLVVDHASWAPFSHDITEEQA